MTTHEDSLTASEVDVGIGEIDPAVPDRLDLGAEQFNPGNFVFEKVVEMTGAAILGKDPTLITHATTFAMAVTTAGSN
jgi:hypothetical protein